MGMARAGLNMSQMRRQALHIKAESTDGSGMVLCSASTSSSLFRSLSGFAAFIISHAHMIL